MMDRLGPEREARRAVWHHTLVAHRLDRPTEIGAAAAAHPAVHAFGTVKRDDVITGLQAENPLAYLDHAPRALVAGDQRVHAGSIDAVQRGQISMTKAGGNNLDQGFAMAGRRNLHFLDRQRLVRREADRGGRADHNASLSGWAAPNAANPFRSSSTASSRPPVLIVSRAMRMSRPQAMPIAPTRRSPSLK